MMFFVAIAVLSGSCWIKESPGPSTPTGAVAVATDLDGGVSVTNTMEVCGINVVWNYTEQTVIFTNRNSDDMHVRYNDLERFPGPWGVVLYGGESHVSRQTVRLGKIVQLNVSSSRVDSGRCDRFVKIRLGP
jgi:hypothetical protein